MFSGALLQRKRKLIVLFYRAGEGPGDHWCLPEPWHGSAVSLLLTQFWSMTPSPSCHVDTNILQPTKLAARNLSDMY